MNRSVIIRVYIAKPGNIVGNFSIEYSLLELEHKNIGLKSVEGNYDVQTWFCSQIKRDII